MPPNVNGKSANLLGQKSGAGSFEKQGDGSKNGASGAVKKKTKRGIKNFCQNINLEEKDPLLDKALDFAKRRNSKFARCEGTTTVFGDKNCYHRRCMCITQKDKLLFPPDPSIFSEEEIDTLEKMDGGITKLPYQICGRHSLTLRIPFVYLKKLTLFQKDLDEKILGGIIQIRKSSRDVPNDKIDSLIDEISAIIPYLTRISRQNAHNARASLKHAIDEYLDFDVDNKRPDKLQKVVDDIYVQINTPQEIKKTALLEEDGEPVDMNADADGS
jgi:hypothetical protein